MLFLYHNAIKTNKIAIKKICGLSQCRMQISALSSKADDFN